jgi:membrane protein
MSSPDTLEWPHNAVTGEVQPVAVEKVSQDQDPLPL